MNRIVYIVLISVIIATLAGGITALIINKHDVKGYEITDAVVVGYKEKDNGYDDFGKKYLYAEIVEFSVDGVKYKLQNLVWSSNPKNIGSSIKVAYDPNSPSNCKFVNNNNSLALILFLFSGGFLIALIIQIVYERKERANKKHYRKSEQSNER